MSANKRAGRSAQGGSVLPLFLLLVCLFSWVSLLTFDAGDWPSPDRYPHAEITANACGKVGAFGAYYLRRIIGDGVFPLVLFASAAAVLRLIRGRIVNIGQRFFGLMLLVVGTSASAQLIASPGANTLAFGSGGLVGAAAASFLSETFAGVGTVLVLGYCLFVGLLFTAEGWVLRISGAVRRATVASGEAIVAARSFLPAPAAVMAGAAEMGRAVRLPRQRETAEETEDSPESEVPKFRFHGARAATRKRRRKADPDQGDLFDKTESNDGVRETETVKAKRPEPRRAATSAKSTVNAPCADVGNQPASGEAYPRPLDAWELPSVTLLAAPEYSFSAAQESVLRAKAKTLEQTLQEFRLDVRVVEIDTGPVITLFELALGAGIKVSQIMALANDIARALRAPNVRIIATIAGKNTIGVEVPNTNKETVRLKGLMLSSEKQIEKMAIPLFLGKDASGAVLVADLSAMPHMLIAGTTGSGKSVALNTIIMSILMCRRPDMVKLILIDPKMVELSLFKDIPHLMAPIVTDMQRAEQILEWAVAKMDERYAIIAEARVRNIGAYNALSETELYKRLEPTTDEERAQIPKHLPYVVIIIDELADLMMTSAKEVEHHLARLAQKSRAVGIHIIVATQRPEAKVVTGLIKSNLPCRCAFRVASRMDSRIVLDQNGAEVLMGQGDMLFLPPGSHKLRRAQGTFIEDDELERVLKFLGKKGGAEFHPELLRMRAKGAVLASERDPLFDRAVDVVIETNRGSVSLLQRRLTIGYARASRLIEQMAAAGIVGDFKGSQAREVAVTAEEWEEMRNRGRTAVANEESPDASADEDGSIDEEEDEWSEEDCDSDEAEGDDESDEVGGGEDADDDELSDRN